MDLSVVPKQVYVHIQFQIFGVLFNTLVEPGDNSTVVPLVLASGLRVVRCCEHVFDLQDLTDVLIKWRSELLDIIGHEYALRAICHDAMSCERFCHTLG